MPILNFIIWNANSEIFTIPFFGNGITLRWYGLLFALGFLISQQILYFIYKKEGKPEKDVDTLTLYMVVATIIGARLGHVLFYEPERYLSEPIKILKIWEGGLASHGAAIAILFALWLYARKKKPGQNYLQVVDRIVILVALTGALIRLGNFFNSEIIGKPTNSRYGVVFARPVTEILTLDENVKNVSYVKEDVNPNENGFYPVITHIAMETEAFSDADYNLHLAVSSLSNYKQVRDHVDFSPDFVPAVVRDGARQGFTKVRLYMAPRHPAQLYESISCVVLFSLLWWLWFREKENLPAGRLLGIFLIFCFGLRFLFEFLKEPQVEFESTLILNMGQILSIPLVLAGIFILGRSFRKKTDENSPLT